MTDGLIYSERVTSDRTEALFLALTLLFLLLIWRVYAVSLDVFAAVFFCLFVLFLFYSVNYRTLVIHLTSESLKLTFGVFTWIVLDWNRSAIGFYQGLGATIFDDWRICRLEEEEIASVASGCQIG